MLLKNLQQDSTSVCQGENKRKKKSLLGFLAQIKCRKQSRKLFWFDEWHLSESKTGAPMPKTGILTARPVMPLITPCFCELSEAPSSDTKGQLHRIQDVDSRDHAANPATRDKSKPRNGKHSMSHLDEVWKRANQYQMFTDTFTP